MDSLEVGKKGQTLHMQGRIRSPKPGGKPGRGVWTRSWKLWTEARGEARKGTEPSWAPTHTIQLATPAYLSVFLD